ncbi:MAG: IS110 family transposase, partial [Bacilli bacterium]
INLTKLSNLLSKHSKGHLDKSSALNLKALAKNSFDVKFTNEACAFEIKQLINQMIFLENQKYL